jgi:aspartyl-tRNA(Asn)/glutamyl-tRNA(Gln) amidotransferase subunit C
MAIDAAEVRRVAALARLEIPEDGIERVAGQLSSVLAFVAKLDALDLTGCEPASLAPADAPPRADVPDGRQFEPGDATVGAPEAEDGFFLVPPIVENVNP